ncbi:oxidoreductase [Flavobacterium sp. '19STA2R22 D10 B1']|uniref:oxidoreductase n=1 Tax=Flavobacterium aerium TaxID=3037261 RepID=UPI00278C241F|nr:oxidoreductase [Flavobacterium sp. '19STA2R22 D10 B1']
MESKKVWLITGASKGLGLVFVKQLLAAGNKVAATTRTIKALTDSLGSVNDNLLPLEVDLLDEKSIQKAVELTLQTFGTIDVVVNNAGYGHFGAIEELSDKESRQNFDVNVFGLLNVIRQIMPHFRKQRSGHIFNIASIGGYTGNFPGVGIYCATKFAVAGLTEALSAEGKSFGIHATVVYPGYFRTNFLSEGSIVLPLHPIAEYEEVRATVNAHQFNIDGNQTGDPEKAIEVILKVASEANPPLHLFLGQDAYDLVKAKDTAIHDDMEAWKAVATTTGFPE